MPKLKNVENLKTKQPINFKARFGCSSNNPILLPLHTFYIQIARFYEREIQRVSATEFTGNR